MYNCYNGTIVILKKLLIVYFKIVLLIMWNSNTHSKKGNTPSRKQQLYNCYNCTIVIIKKVYREHSKKVLLIM